MKAVIVVVGLLLASMAGANCFTSDVRTICCPAACAAKNGPHWYEADRVLRGCMTGLRCDGGKNATVSMVCGC